MRLVDLDAKEPYILDGKYVVNVISLKPHVHFDYDAIREEIEKKMNVVRCKDCHWRTGLEEHTAWHPCDEMAVNDNWFCADGERKDGGKEEEPNVQSKI